MWVVRWLVGGVGVSEVEGGWVSALSMAPMVDCCGGQGGVAEGEEIVGAEKKGRQ